jgi:hypothetical protein
VLMLALVAWGLFLERNAVTITINSLIRSGRAD